MAFPTNRPVLLSDMAREMHWLKIECRQCGRYKRLSILRLIREHGATATAWSIMEAVSATYPQRVPSRHWMKACHLAPDPATLQAAAVKGEKR